MDLDNILFRGAVALSLGLIIGYQRERKESALAGIRTFPLIALMGFFCALLQRSGMGWIIPAGIVSTAIILAVALVLNHRSQEHLGITTEVAVFLTFLMGAAFAVLSSIEPIVVAGGIMALLLHLKESMHSWVERMNGGEVRSIMQLVLVGFVILPLLPDRAFDPYEVLNPRRIWLMVVLISGISVVSYSIQKMKGDASTLWTGVLGGLVSSTATTVTLSRVSAKNPDLMYIVPATVIASAVAFVRVLALLIVVAPDAFGTIIGPMSILFFSMLILSAVSYVRLKLEANGAGEVRNDQTPSQLRAALAFGLMFAIVLFAAAWTRNRFGEHGLYPVSVLSGLIDVDAITISMAQLMEQAKLSDETGWRLVLVAFLSNLVFKLLVVLVIARGRGRRHIIAHFIASLLIGMCVLLWA